MVIGDPVTVNKAGAVRLTELTVPPPVPGGVWHEPSPRIYVVLLQVPVHSPRMSVEAASANPEPVPFNGPFKTVDSTKVPEVVIGDPVTVIPENPVRPTLETPPPPPLHAVRVGGATRLAQFRQ